MRPETQKHLTDQIDQEFAKGFWRGLWFTLRMMVIGTGVILFHPLRKPERDR